MPPRRLTIERHRELMLVLSTAIQVRTLVRAICSTSSALYGTVLSLNYWCIERQFTMLQFLQGLAAIFYEHPLIIYQINLVLPNDHTLELHGDEIVIGSGGRSYISCGHCCSFIDTEYIDEHAEYHDLLDAQERNEGVQGNQHQDAELMDLDDAPLPKISTAGSSSA